MAKKLISILLIGLLCACSRHAYVPPSTEIPDNWKYSPNDENCKPASTDLDNWWEVFKDPLLNDLEEYALAQNQDLAIAMARVDEANAIAYSVEADLFPQVNLNVNWDDRGFLAKTFTEPEMFFRVHQQEYFAAFSTVYNLDFWDRIKNQYYSSVANAEARQAAYFAIMLTLTSDVAANYYILRGLDAEDKLLTSTIKLRQDALDINTDRYKAGLVNYADVSRAEVELDRVISERLDVKRRRAIAENLLATLLGTFPSELCIPFDPLDEIIPCIPPGMTSDVMLRRPDIAEAERNVASAFYLEQSQIAELYPNIQLTNTLGFLSPDWGKFFSWKSRFWQIGATLIQKVFDAGKTRAQIEALDAVYRRTLAEYQQTIYIAFRQVEDALANLEYQDAQSVALKKLVDASQETSDILTARYRSGLSGYLDVVEADRSLLEAQIASVQLVTQEFTSTVRLIQALGGSWEDQTCNN